LKNFDLIRVRFTVSFRKLGLVIEQVHLRRAAILAQLDDCLGLAWKMSLSRGERTRRTRGFRRTNRGQQPGLIEQACQG
jgi:hypothetical protein